MNMTLWIILQMLFLVGTHWVADFITQTDWQACNKSKNNHALWGHVYNYMLTFGGAGIVLSFFFDFLCGFPTLYGTFSWILFILVNGVLHFITDYVTSRLNSKLWAGGQTHDFFVSVGFDQVIHYVTLFLTYYWIILK